MIKLRGIKKNYGQKIILDHVDLDIERGEIIGLLAPNGMGKTTFGKHAVELLQTIHLQTPEPNAFCDARDYNSARMHEYNSLIRTE